MIVETASLGIQFDLDPEIIQRAQEWQAAEGAYQSFKKIYRADIVDDRIHLENLKVLADITWGSFKPIMHEWLNACAGYCRQ